MRTSRLFLVILVSLALSLPIHVVRGHEMVNTAAQLAAQSGQTRTVRQVGGTVSSGASASATPTSVSISATVPVITPGVDLCGNGRDAQFLQCLSASRANQTDTCGPLQALQNFAYFSCMCRTFGVIVTCYDICPAQGNNYLLEDAQRVSFCSAADLARPRSTTTTRRPSTVSRTYANGGNNGEGDPTYTNTLLRVTNRANLADGTSNDGGNRAGAAENVIAAAIGGAAAVAAAVFG